MADYQRNKNRDDEDAPPPNRVRDISLDIFVAIVDKQFGRYGALIAYLGLKQMIPNWQLPKFERYVLFPGAIIVDAFKGKVVGRGARRIPRGRY